MNEMSKLMLECINEIADYFEYRHESERDKKKVMDCVDSLTEKLAKINLLDIVSEEWEKDLEEDDLEDMIEEITSETIRNV
jgi:hypothetical protein